MIWGKLHEIGLSRKNMNSMLYPATANHRIISWNGIIKKIHEFHVMTCYHKSCDHFMIFDYNWKQIIFLVSSIFQQNENYEFEKTYIHTPNVKLKHFQRYAKSNENQMKTNIMFIWKKRFHPAKIINVEKLCKRRTGSKQAVTLFEAGPICTFVLYILGTHARNTSVGHSTDQVWHMCA